MKIVSSKIPIKMKALPDLYTFLNKQGGEFVSLLAHEIAFIEKPASNSNASWKHIADKINTFSDDTVCFEYYCSKNPFVGHVVISHSNFRTINYNTRFHSCDSFTLVDWIHNFGHELTHLADQRSPLTFGHKNEHDFDSAPFVVGQKAQELYLSREWL